jgi:hypothetical protein
LEVNWPLFYATTEYSESAARKMLPGEETGLAFPILFDANEFGKSI